VAEQSAGPIATEIEEACPVGAVETLKKRENRPLASVENPPRYAVVVG
jgi:hypothetical protein